MGSTTSHHKMGLQMVTNSTNKNNKFHHF